MLRRRCRLLVRPTWSHLLPVLAGLLSLMAFLPGIDWGLPLRADDRFLFGDRTPWTGQEIIALAGGLDAETKRGADVDDNPLDRSETGPIVLNKTDAQRAEIVRRYRLFSHQPDEFINFAAIAGMGQRRDLDPRLYQYGGLWLYPIAGLLGAAHVVGYVQLTGDLAFYLDHPAEFGKFYVVARLYSAMWGAIGAGVIFVLIRRLSQSNFAAMCGAVAFAFLPVVVTAAHEAKPHLAGATLMLWAVLKADDYVRTGRRRDAVWAGALCGGASAMVVSMVVSFALLPVMGLLRWRRATSPPAEAGEAEKASGGATVGDSGSESASPASAGGGGRWLRMTLLSLLVGMGVYAITNPYVIYHLLFDRAIFQSNIGNSTAMYGARDFGDAFRRGGELILLSMGGNWGALLLAAGVTVGLAFLVAGGNRQKALAKHLAPLLLTAMLAVAFFYFPLAAGKPPEYARFGLVLTAGLLVLGIGGIGIFADPSPKANRRRSSAHLAGYADTFAASMLLMSLLGGIPYLMNFVADRNGGTRERAAVKLAQMGEQGRALALSAEPAPYSVPPFNLWHWKATLMTAQEAHALSGIADSPDLHVATRDQSRGLGNLGVGSRYDTPISWANKPIAIRPIHPEFR